MSLFKECERIKEERRKGLNEEFKKICDRIIYYFKRNPTLKSIRLENYPEDARVTISDSHDEKFCICWFEYGKFSQLYYAMGFYDLYSEEGYNEFLSDLLYYMYINTDLEFSQDADSIIIHL